MYLWNENHRKAQEELTASVEKLAVARHGLVSAEKEIAVAEEKRVLFQQEVWNQESAVKRATMNLQEVALETVDSSDLRKMEQEIREREAEKSADVVVTDNECDGSQHSEAGDEVH